MKGDAYDGLLEKNAQDTKGGASAGARAWRSTDTAGLHQNRALLGTIAPVWCNRRASPAGARGPYRPSSGPSTVMESSSAYTSRRFRR